MAKLNKLHKRHLFIRYDIIFTGTKPGSVTVVKETPDETMNMELDIPRRWTNKDIAEFAGSHIGRKGRTDSGKEFKVQAVRSVSIFFPDDNNRELKLYDNGNK